MCYNKELCIKLKETKIDDQNLWLSAGNLCTEFCKPFENLLQNEDAEKFYCFCYTNILKSSKYLPQISEDYTTTTTKIYFSNKIQVYEYILSATILTEDNIENNTRY